MLSKKEKIRIFIGFLILSGVFVFLLMSSWIEKGKNIDEIVNSSYKYEKAIPQNFNNEFFLIENVNYSKFLVNDSENVLGFSLSGKPIESFKLVKSELEKNHWNFTESGSETAGSFWKPEGEITWIFLNCVEVGDETSVVFTCNK